MKLDDARSEAIDVIISTLYARGARGYSITDKVLEADAVKMIRKEISKLDKREQPKVKNEAEYRLERFKEFLHKDQEFKNEVLRLAREKQISFEKASELAEKQ